MPDWASAPIRSPLWRSITLIAIPAALVLFPLSHSAVLAPFYVARTDPAYAYLLNALAVACGRSPFHIDHPGTTVQELGAPVIALMALARGASPWCPTEQVLAYPEDFLTAINIGLLLIIAAASFALAMRTYRLTQSMLAALLPQVALASSSVVARALVQVSPEPLLIALTLLLAFTLLPIATDRHREARTMSAIAGAIAGLGLVTKITFAPLLLYGLLFRNLRDKGIFALSCLAAIVFFTVPIWRRHQEFFGWLYALATRSQVYGKGPTGLPPMQELADNTIKLIGADPHIFLLAVLGAATALLLPSKPDAQTARYGILTFGILLVQWAITIKHPGGHYLLPALVAAIASLGIVLMPALRAQPSRWKTAWLGIAVALIFVAASNMSGFRSWAFELGRNNQFAKTESAALERLAGNRCKAVVRLQEPSPASALWFGDAWTNHRFSEALRRQYPNFIFYNDWARTFQSYNASYDAPEALRFLQAQYGNTDLCVITRDGLRELMGLPSELIAKQGRSVLDRLLP